MLSALIYSDQKTEKYNEGGNTINGDYDYTQDGPNTPAGVHRVKSYPLKDGAGDGTSSTVPGRGRRSGKWDYQDYVFVLGNVSARPGAALATSMPTKEDTAVGRWGRADHQQMAAAAVVPPEASVSTAGPPWFSADAARRGSCWRAGSVRWPTEEVAGVAAYK